MILSKRPCTYGGARLGLKLCSSVQQAGLQVDCTPQIVGA